MSVRPNTKGATIEAAPDDVRWLAGGLVVLMIVAFIFALSLGAVLLANMLLF